MTLDPLLQQIREQTGDEIFRSRAPHVLAVSGGRDSMLLLHLYARMREQGLLPVPPVVFHMNHGLRESARLDEELLFRECSRLDLALHIHRLDVGRFARRSRMGLEEAGRHLRYRQLRRLCHLYPGSIAVTAHHADDYLESVLLHMIRGGGEASFRTMDLYGRTGQVDLFRPLLFFSRDTLERTIRDSSVPFLEDESNASDRFLRNRIRKYATPFLKREGLDPVALWIRMHDQELRQPVAASLPAADHIRLDGALFRSSNGGEIKRLLDMAFRRLDLAPASAALVREFHQQLARQGPDGGLRIHLEQRDFHLWSSERGPLWILRHDSKLLQPFRIYPSRMASKASHTGTEEMAVNLEMDAVDGKDHTEDRGPGVSGEIVVEYNGKKKRYRLRSEERFTIFRDGMRCHLPVAEGELFAAQPDSKKLKKLLQELRIPPSVRRRMPLIENSRTGFVTAVCLSFLDGMRDLRFPAGDVTAKEEGGGV